MDFHIQIQRGFTLVEMMITLAIAAISITLAVPGFQSMIERNRVAASINNFVSHLHHARAEAIKIGEWVMLCPSNNGASCISDYTQWGRGYIEFVDENRDRARGDDEQVLGYFQGDEKAITIHSSSSHRKTIAYRPSGRAWSFNTTVRFCAENDAKHNRTVIISATGRPRVDTKMPDGSAIACN